MERSLENPFREDHKPRKPGVAGLVGEVFGEKAEAAYAKQVSEGKKKQSAPAPQENWESTDITMSAAEKAGMDIERTHVRLQNIPTFSKLPSVEVIKKDFKCDWLWEEEYRTVRPATDFALTQADLESIGLDEHVRSRILEAMARAKEAPPLAKVFDITDIIQQKRQTDPKHPASLSTKEVLEAIDAAGYRPATLQELLAYGRDHWQPDVDLDDLSEDERQRLHLANTRFIHALGAPFSRSGGSRFAPYLSGHDSKRKLNANDFDYGWYSVNRFLVFRKGSS